MKILVLDNYDSFTYNLVALLKSLKARVEVVQSDEFTLAKDLESFDFSHLLIAPGPNSPKEVPLCLEAILYFRHKSILGVCLGYQCIVEAYGGKIARLDSPKHGKVATIKHKKHELFAKIPKEFEVCLYHSLHAKSLPNCLKSLAKSKEGVEMALAHKRYKTFGVQFHPEAILSTYGKRLLKNWLYL
ncbi:anthranilate synthase component II [uncultured Helicobacter sp.]|uniref:anthranilate synthase component II n=1 Tax=uncultured Helicobacter sp. TaxID=175537 RepID=UPI003752EAC8